MRNWVFEAISLTLFLTLGLAGTIAASKITGISFDPLGPASTPYTISGFTVLLSVICVWKLLKTVSKAEADAHLENIGRIYTAREIAEVLALFGFVIVYVLALFVFRVPFAISTLVLLPASACLLERTVTGRIPLIALATGAFIGFGGELLFTRVFFIDLPTLW